MEFTEYMLWKAGVLLAIIAVWQFIRGLNGLPVQQEPYGTQAEQNQDQPSVPELR